MKNRKLLAAATSVALVAVVGIGATLAYFTDSDEANNVVTMGHVDISLNESTTSEDGKVADEVIGGEGMVFDNIMPGDILSKNPWIFVEADSQDAYLRMKMDITAEENSGITEADLDELEQNLRDEITGEDTGWYYAADGYYYYNISVAENTRVDFFKTVDIPASWTNNTADGTFNISLTAEAIQSENVTPEMTGNMISGWPAAEIQEYTK